VQYNQNVQGFEAAKPALIINPLPHPIKVSSCNGEEQSKKIQAHPSAETNRPNIELRRHVYSLLQVSISAGSATRKLSNSRQLCMSEQLDAETQTLTRGKRRMPAQLLAVPHLK